MLEKYVLLFSWSTNEVCIPVEYSPTFVIIFSKQKSDENEAAVAPDSSNNQKPMK